MAVTWYLLTFFDKYVLVIINSGGAWGLICNSIVTSLITSLSFLRVFLNVCFSYASRYEITDTIQSLVEGSHHGTLLPR